MALTKRNAKALLIDVGNTSLKWGVLADNHIGKTGSITHERLKETGFAALTSKAPRSIDCAMVCNVAGAGIASKLTGIISVHCKVSTRFAACEKSAYGVTNGYKQTRRLGVDRWVAMVGAFNEFKSALCIVDAGTAVTIDAIDKTGSHLGGQIIPGLQLMGQALSNRTSDIVATGQRAKDPGDGLGIFGRSTNEAVANGSLTAICGAIEQAAKRMRAASLRPKIVLTGGDASRILKQLNNNAIHRPHLVLQGLSIMVQSDK